MLNTNTLTNLFMITYRVASKVAWTLDKRSAVEFCFLLSNVGRFGPCKRRIKILISAQSWKYSVNIKEWTLGCINFNFFGNIKNRQPPYASLGSLEDQNVFLFFFTQKPRLAGPPKFETFGNFYRAY